MKRYLVLENGEVFAGLAFGAPCDTVGELVFTTGMNGYIETLTDPSYCGQIVLQTFPLIGNYGIIPADFEGKCCVRGYVVREQCQTPSNFRCEETLDAFLKANNIPGIAGIDTRAVTRILREAGTMNAAICDTVPDDLAPLRAYRITDPVPQVTTPEPYTLRPEGGVLHRVALIDYGAKRNIARELCRRGCAVTVLPCSAKAEDILAAGPDGIVLSDGPGDPWDNPEIIGILRALAESGRPMFGWGLGHQLMAVAADMEIEKLPVGHRGSNQPVRNLDDGRVMVTEQNHGYTVALRSVKDEVADAFLRNVNDGTVEGLRYRTKPILTVQFEPSDGNGYQDTAWVFDAFVRLLREKPMGTRG